MKTLVFILLVTVLLLLQGCSKDDTLPILEDIKVTSLTSDFKVAPNTTWAEGINFYNVSIASDENCGFLITWTNEYHPQPNTYTLQNYACRISTTGVVLDTEAIPICESVWPYYSTSAVFAGGNWIICSTQGSLDEYVQVTRLSPSGEVLDETPVNICGSIGFATIMYPTIASNGNEILCVTGIAGKGLYGSIFDPDLNILIDRFLIYEQTFAGSFPRITVNGDNFQVIFQNWSDDVGIKLVTIGPEGQILSTQTVNADSNDALRRDTYAPTVIADNNISYIMYFKEPINMEPVIYVRRYSSDGNPLDSKPVRIYESKIFDRFFAQVLETVRGAYYDLVSINQYVYFFWSRLPDTGISMMSFDSDLSTAYQPVPCNSQCKLCLKLTWPEFPSWTNSYSLIRAASLGNKVLTVWIDEREGSGKGRVYGNLFEIE